MTQPPAAAAEHHAHPPPALRGGPSVLRVDGLTTGYGAVPALTDVTFSVPAGNLVAVIGPNGSGKSTLIKALAGLLPPWQGTIDVFGRPPAAARPRIGYMPQVEKVDWGFPVTVREVVAMGLYRRRWGLAKLRGLVPGSNSTIDRALDRLGLTALAATQVGELSGGQRRRVLLARTLVKDPDLLLLDEPAAGLDVTVEEDLLTLMLQLAADGKTLLVATHDIASVFEHYSLTVCLNRRLVVAGSPAQVLSEDVLVRTFGRHLVVFHRDEHGYTVEPHVWHGRHDHD